MTLFSAGHHLPRAIKKETSGIRLILIHSILNMFSKTVIFALVLCLVAASSFASPSESFANQVDRVEEKFDGEVSQKDEVADIKDGVPVPVEHVDELAAVQDTSRRICICRIRYRRCIFFCRRRCRTSTCRRICYRRCFIFYRICRRRFPC